MSKLTNKQQQFYDTLISYIRKYFRWPTYKELADRLGFSSENSVTQYYDALVSKQFLKKDSQGNYTFTNPADVWIHENGHRQPTSIPIVGEITAGSMQEAIEADLGEVTIGDFFPNASNVFALRVKGDSMKDLGISTGDKVILSKTDLRDGDVGAVLYDGNTTLKRAHIRTTGIRLEPANPAYDDIIIKPGEFEEVTVLGKYLGHITDEGLVKSPFR
ncbi:LexA family protein [Fodinibius saliphilus]|uniref:LexA family protein n=1 Tax=Fodinibius saliphilus TaxID=1920650 RepID=UPI001109DFF4|nr:S24 family peptidase [Fodinibius saliphilus]